MAYMKANAKLFADGGSEWGGIRGRGLRGDFQVSFCCQNLGGLNSES
jgi:hypothetical protein